jgi:hypothetical protein
MSNGPFDNLKERLLAALAEKAAPGRAQNS